MKKMFVLLLSAILLIGIVGCSGESDEIKEEEVSVLTEDKEREITKWIDDATMYDKAMLKGNKDTLTIWIDLKDEAAGSAEEYANGLTDRVAKLYDYDISVQVTAMQKIEGSDKVKAFENSLFIPESGKTVYETY